LLLFLGDCGNPLSFFGPNLFFLASGKRRHAPSANAASSVFAASGRSSSVLGGAMMIAVGRRCQHLREQILSTESGPYPLDHRSCIVSCNFQHFCHALSVIRVEEQPRCRCKDGANPHEDHWRHSCRRPRAPHGPAIASSLLLGRQSADPPAMLIARLGPRETDQHCSQRQTPIWPGSNIWALDVVCRSIEGWRWSPLAGISHAEMASRTSARPPAMCWGTRGHTVLPKDLANAAILIRSGKTIPWRIALI